MIPWGLLGQGVKAGLEIYKNKKKSEVAMSEAQLLHAEKMKRGEIEYSGQIMQNQKQDWKDEFVLLTISSPLFLLAYSVFAEDEKMQEKIDLYFQKLQEMPWWIVGLWVSVVAAIYGLKATDVININKNKYGDKTMLKGKQKNLDANKDGKITKVMILYVKKKKKYAMDGGPVEVKADNAVDLVGNPKGKKKPIQIKGWGKARH
jgi:hypothetical protein